MARFDFEGEHSDELSFSEGDVIQLKEYMGQDWARGQIGGHTGIFPLNFVDVIEDLPPPPSQKPSKKVALPGKIFWRHSDIHYVLTFKLYIHTFICVNINTTTSRRFVSFTEEPLWASLLYAGWYILTVACQEFALVFDFN